MSQSARTRPLPAAQRPAPQEPVDDLDGGLAISPSEIVDRLWRIFTSMRTALVLILFLAGLALIGTLLVQAPGGLSSDPQQYAAWLDSVRPKYGGWTNVMDTLQLFGIFSSVWFKGIVVALTTSILACSVNRFRGLWKTAIHPRTKMTPTFYERAPHHADITAPVDDQAALADIRKVFGSRHFRTVVEQDGDVTHVYADRFRWAPFGTLMAHISLVLILVGALVGSSLGFRNADFAATVGSRVDVGNGTGLSVLAKSFTDSYYADGSPSDYASDLVLYKDGTQVAAQTIRVNEPLHYGDITFYQSFFGASAVMSVADASGKALFNAGVPLLWSSNDGKQRIGQIALPDQGLTVFVIGAASGEVDPNIKAGEMQLEIYKSGGDGVPIGTQIVSQGKPTTISGLTYTFQREQQFTGLIVAKDPGSNLVWLGAILLIGGLFLVFFFPNRRIWARLGRNGEQTELRLGATSRHDATFGADFQNLVNDMQLALSGPSAS